MKPISVKYLGFTLIELVMVILLLGTLAITAFPKFVDLSGDARYASAKSHAGALSDAVSIVHAAYLAQGNPLKSSILTNGDKRSVSVNGNTVFVNGLGWPECSMATGATNVAKCGDGKISSSARECTSLWNALMTVDNAAPYYQDWNGEPFFNFEPDSPASSVSSDSDSCQYTVADNYAERVICILYNTETGKVTTATDSNCNQDRVPAGI